MADRTVWFFADGEWQQLANNIGFDSIPAGATGATGPAGPTGPTGATGATGPGVPTGGTTGQVLAKNSATNYDTHWVNDAVGIQFATNPQSGTWLLVSTTGATSSNGIELDASGGHILFQTTGSGHNIELNSAGHFHSTSADHTQITANGNGLYNITNNCHYIVQTLGHVGGSGGPFAGADFQLAGSFSVELDLWGGSGGSISLDAGVGNIVLTTGSAATISVSAGSFTTDASTKLGFHGATPVVLAAHPTTLSDVITILHDLGLCG
jgi:hypothetical protein